MEDSLDWSEEEYRLTEFINKFTLPQLVRVEQGFHSGEEDTALGWGQVLTIHVLREADTVFAKDTQYRKVYIPKTCSQKVEVLMPGARNQYYETVAELSHAFPPFARVSREPQNQTLTGLHSGDKLALKRIIKKKTILECDNENGVRIRLPMSLKARFVPLQDGREYFIHEVLHLFKMPVLVQFIDSKVGKSATASTVFNSSLGVLSLEEVMKEESIICSTKDETTEKRYVVTIPRSMNITVAAAREAVVEDKDYVRLCRELNDGVELSKVDDLESENVYASRQEIREYMQLHLLNVQSVYAKPVPPRPLPRIAKSSELSLFPKSPGNKMKEYDVDDDIYESIPVKSSTIKKQQFTSSNSNENQYQDISQAIVAPKAKVKDIKTENNKPSISEESEADQTTEPESLPLVPTSPKPMQNAVDLSSLSVDEVAELLAKHRLGTFAETFRYEEIDGSMLLELDVDSLKDLGLNNFQVKKLLMLMQGWKPKTDG